MSKKTTLDTFLLFNEVVIFANLLFSCDWFSRQSFSFEVSISNASGLQVCDWRDPPFLQYSSVSVVLSWFASNSEIPSQHWMGWLFDVGCTDSTGQVRFLWKVQALSVTCVHLLFLPYLLAVVFLVDSGSTVFAWIVSLRIMAISTCGYRYLSCYPITYQIRYFGEVIFLSIFCLDFYKVELQSLFFGPCFFSVFL